MKGIIGIFMGMPVYPISEDVSFINKQFRFPKHKKKRVLKKWAKRPENYRKERHTFVVGDAIYADPLTITAMSKFAQSI